MGGPHSVIPLLTLDKVQVRDAWPDEARHFTPWLATDEGLSLLSEKIGVPLRLVKREHPVGRYSLDILATPVSIEGDNESGDLVIIENQFGSTDHDHLGKLLTYAAGVGREARGGRTIVWISENLREEHQRALEWLNEVTHSEIRFFGVQLELYRIGDSSPAPVLNVLVRPNEFVRASRQATAGKGPSERNLFYIEYWTAFNAYCANQNAPFSLRDPQPTYYAFSALGRSGVSLSFLALRRDKWVGCEIFIRDANPGETFRRLREDATSIDASIPGLVWDYVEGAKSAKIYLKRTDWPPGKRELWADQHAWLLTNGALLFTAFSPRLRALA